MAVNRVEGDNSGNLIDDSYAADPEGERIDNADAPDGSNNDVVDGFGGDDTILSGAGDDTVFGGSGSDSVDGGAGDDLIIGDSNDAGIGGREVFRWSLAPDPNDADPIEGGDEIQPFIQNTGTVEVNYFVFAQTGPVDNSFADNTQNVESIVTGGAPADTESSLSSMLEGEASVDLKLQFSAPVTDVSFQINDLDNLEHIQIFAFDPDDNLLPVTFTTGSGVSVTSPEEAVGAGSGTDDDAPHSLGVSIAGPVEQFIIRYSTPEGDSDGINVSDVYFNSPEGIVDDGAPGDDTLLGGDGSDTLLGEEGADTLDGGVGADLLLGGSGQDTLTGGVGDDTLDGGEGVDTLSGGDARDLLIGGFGDTVDGGTGDGGMPGDDFDTLDLSGVTPTDGSVELTNVTIDADGDSRSGTAIIREASGGELGRVTFTEIENIVPCFTPGTLIATPRGEVPVEELREGDRVITRDNGLQEIRWTGARGLGAGALMAAPHLRPVLIRAGALGHGLPERDMLVSPQHRLLLTSERAALYFGEREVLAAARHLTGMEGIDEVAASGVTYIHFLCDRHEVVLSNGAWTESFQPGDQVMEAMGSQVREEIFALFPELREKAGIDGYQAARRSLKRHEARLLVE
ncbi:MAG: type I secretion protein [Roseovarius sp.]|nr:type I secretion protein [Roseovarius sp.]MBK43852.1 type I secretion protein [Roseovarius sp.]